MFGSNCPALANFQPECGKWWLFSDWCETVNILQNKYFPPRYEKNMGFFWQQQSFRGSQRLHVSDFNVIAHLGRSLLAVFSHAFVLDYAILILFSFVPFTESEHNIWYNEMPTQIFFTSKHFVIMSIKHQISGINGPTLM